MKKLICYITPKVLENSYTIELIHSMKENGMDILELGVAFSDPVADGKIIQEASLIALQNNFKTKDVFEISSKIDIDTYLMGYMNSFFDRFELFLEKSVKNNIKGFIIPDMPYEESLFFNDLFEKYNKELVSFVAPTTPIDRMKMILENAKGFIYLVAYAGVTGSSKVEDLSNILSYIKSFTNKDVYLGFGVNKENAKEKSKGVDGVIVGSAIVDVLIDDSLSFNEKKTKISDIVYTIKNKINE